LRSAPTNGEGGGGPTPDLGGDGLRLCERGQLAYVRVSTQGIRIAEPDLLAFVHRRRSGKS